MTIHGSKLELKQLKYPENRAKRISTLPEDNFWFDHWISNLFSVQETRHLEIYKDTKVNSITHPKLEKAKIVDVSKGGHGLCVATGGGRRTLYGHRKLKGQNSTINASRFLILNQKKKRF